MKKEYKKSENQRLKEELLKLKKKNNNLSQKLDKIKTKNKELNEELKKNGVRKISITKG